MKIVILNNSVIALASTKEYSSENLEYFRLSSSPKAYFFFFVTAGEEDEEDEDEDEDEDEEEKENGKFQSAFICQRNTVASLKGQFIAWLVYV